jgi:serine phosphatase RsbU (regulator of sigma subunit)/anti-sigma regulatory factor (Ser/Thr protein kinase)
VPKKKHIMPMGVKRRAAIAVLSLLMGIVGVWADEASELRQQLPTLKGEKRLEALEQLYALSLGTDDTAQQLKCLNEWIAEAHSQEDKKTEAFALINRASYFYNLDENDSVLFHVPRDLEIIKHHGLWKEYYELWTYLCKTYIYSGKNKLGLREVQTMFDDAMKRDNKCGMGLAYFLMGVAYYNMGDVSECINAYEKGLEILPTVDPIPADATELYANLGDVLNERQDFAGLEKLTVSWKTFLQRFVKSHKMNPDGTFAQRLWFYYYVACTQAAIGQDRLDEAENQLAEVQKRIISDNSIQQATYLNNRAQLYLKEGKFDKALQTNTERMELMEANDDKSVLIMVRRQRAEILEKLGRFEEAAKLYRQMYLINDSINSYEMKNQLSEMNTLFQVNEMKMEQERAQFLFVIIVAAVILVALIVFLLFRMRAAKRLKIAHDKLEQAHGELLTAYDNLEETTKAKERIESDLRIARDIQMSMVPSAFPDRADVDLYASMTPARAVGGDLYDFIVLDDQLYFCVGDVSGKGVPASLFMAQATRLFHTLAKLRMAPAEIATRLNDELAADNEQGMFVTMFIGAADLATGQLRYCNAGHNPPVLKGQFLEMEPNAPIGLWPGLDYVGEEMADISGCPLFVYTDGLNEAENQQQEQFGDDHLLKLLQETPFESSQQTVEMLCREVEQHRDGAEPNDDLTLMCVRITGNKTKHHRNMKKEICIRNQVGELERVNQFVEEIGEELGLDPELQMNLNLVMEEMVSNVIFYAYPEGTDADIELTAETNGKELTFVLTDQGREFDPTMKEDADVNVNPADRDIGGMGIYIVKNIMNQVSYQRLEGKNLLTMKKVIGEN